MLQIDQLLKEIEEDSKINKNDLEYEIIRCHSLLAKYLRYHLLLLQLMLFYFFAYNENNLLELK